MTFAKIHTQRLACQRNNLPCAPSILKHHVSLGHKWVSRGFTLTRYLGKGSVPSIYEKPKDSLDTYYPRNVLWMFLWDPAVKHQYPKSPPPPLPKKKPIFFSDGVGLFEICFQSFKMTDPTGWAYFKTLSRSTKTCQAQINNNSSIAKIDIF